MEIVIASTSVHAIREIRAMLKALRRFDIFTLHDFPQCVHTAASGDTFEQMASSQALLTAKALNKVVIADASGLVVPALQGLPGLASQHYAGALASDKENRDKLLHDMKGLIDVHRQAYLECCLAVATPLGINKCVKGVSEGIILDHERGRYGYAYDSIFLKHDYSKTFAELDEDTKNRISHRRKAFDKLILTLEALS
ncbi:MAG: non-canonical purine NTP pyrophosphatase [Chlamydiae bacterium]|nr:non-canonical purine NTP pyrophosphatase [Chlamydiota bacterium]